MRNPIITIFFLSLCGIVHADGRHNEMITIEKSVEAVEFQMSNATGNGYILAKECSACPQVHLNITITTQAFSNRKPVPLSQVPAIMTSPITVIYDPKTMNAKRIIW